MATRQQISSSTFVLRDAKDLEFLFKAEVKRGGKIEVYPDGGGHIRTMPLSEFDASFRAVSEKEMEAIRNNYTPVGVFGDWMDTEDGIPLAAFTNGSNWNGFACPCFELRPFLDALGNGCIFQSDGEAFGMGYYDKEQDAIVTVTTSGEPLPEYVTEDFVRAAVAEDKGSLIELPETELELRIYDGFDVKTPDGTKHVYAVGSGSWTWTLADEPDAAQSAKP